MLNHDDERLVIKSLRPVLAKAGFKRRESTWYRFSPETLQILDLQPASTKSSEKVYFNLGVMPRSLKPTNRVRVFDCHVYGRLDGVVPDKEYYAGVTNFGNQSYRVEERLAGIVSIIEEHALPLLDSWQRQSEVDSFAHSRPYAGFTIRTKTDRAG